MPTWDIPVHLELSSESNHFSKPPMLIFLAQYKIGWPRGSLFQSHTNIEMIGIRRNHEFKNKRNKTESEENHNPILKIVSTITFSITLTITNEITGIKKEISKNWISGTHFGPLSIHWTDPARITWNPSSYHRPKGKGTLHSLIPPKENFWNNQSGRGQEKILGRYDGVGGWLVNLFLNFFLHFLFVFFLRKITTFYTITATFWYFWIKISVLSTEKETHVKLNLSLRSDVRRNVG